MKHCLTNSKHRHIGAKRSVESSNHAGQTPLENNDAPPSSLVCTHLMPRPQLTVERRVIFCRWLRACVTNVQLANRHRRHCTRHDVVGVAQTLSGPEKLLFCVPMDELLQTENDLLSQITSIGTQKRGCRPWKGEENYWGNGKDDLHFTLF